MGIVAKIYANQLQWYGHGMPLWIPEPVKGQEVRIGDVGVVDENGQFLRFFNVTVGPDHPYNRKGLPADFERLHVDHGDISTISVRDGPFTSTSVRCTKMSGHVSGQSVVANAGGNVSYAFECTQKQGAMLILREAAHNPSVSPRSNTFKQYMSRHYTKWHELVTQVLRLDYKVEDIILVRGTVKTSAKSWAVAAYLEDGPSMHKVSVHVQVGSGLGMGFDVASENAGSTKFDYRISTQLADSPHTDAPHVPTLSLDPTPSALSQATDQPSLSEQEELPEVIYERERRRGSVDESVAHHCLFLQYFKLKPRWAFPPKIVANAGPDCLPSPDDPALSPAVVAEAESYDVVAYPSDEENRTAADYALDYILQNSDCAVALISDSDIAALIEAAGGAWDPADFGQLFDSLKPTIHVDALDGYGLLDLQVLGTTEQRTSPRRRNMVQPLDADRDSHPSSYFVESDQSARGLTTFSDETTSAPASRSPDSATHHAIGSLAPRSVHHVTGGGEDQMPSKLSPSLTREDMANAYTQRQRTYADMRYTLSDRSHNARSEAEPDKPLASGNHDWRLELNNLLQRSYGTTTLNWVDTRSHDSSWVCIAYINNVEYGRGQGWTKSDARKAASKEAFSQLQRHLYNS